MNKYTIQTCLLVETAITIADFSLQTVQLATSFFVCPMMHVYINQPVCGPDIRLMHACMHGCINAHIHTRINTNMNPYKHKNIHHMYKEIQRQKQTLHIHNHTNIYVNTCMHTYTASYMRIYKHMYTCQTRARREHANLKKCD